MALHVRALSRFGITIGVAAAFASCSASQPLATTPHVVSAAARPKAGSETFHYTGRAQQFVVPHGLTTLTVIARGAAGSGLRGFPCGPGCFGRGGRIYAEIPVTPGTTLYVYVGGRGKYGGTGGFNGGGNSGTGPYGVGNPGGGASDVREGGRALKDRILVAAGGGGEASGGKAGYYYEGFGANGGGENGESGGCAVYECGGGGGSQTQGGAGGAAVPGDGNPGQAGFNGVLGFGGDGGSGGEAGCRSSCFPGGAGGGGGGGYYGGGGGGGAASGNYDNSGGGGGGGSSYVEPSAIKFTMWSGWKRATGDGVVVISW